MIMTVIMKLLRARLLGAGGGDGRLWWRFYYDRILIAHATEVLVHIQSHCGNRYRDGEASSPLEEALSEEDSS